MSRPPLFGKQPPPDKVLAGREKRRLIFMAVLLGILLIGYAVTRFQASEQEAAMTEELEESIEEPLVEEVVVPELDRSRLEGKIHDATESERLLRESEALAVLVEYVRGFGEGHYAALGRRDLDPSVLAEIAADPDSFRGSAFRARGWIDEVRRRERPGDGEEIDGRLRLEDGGYAYFTVLDAPESLILDDFVRVDGVFFKLFRDEGEDGEWIEGPYLVGTRMVRSYPRPGEIDTEELRSRLARVTDDSISEGITRFEGDAGLARWYLMGWARDVGEAETDWAAAPELDNAAMTELLKNGREFRGKPFRIPISRNLHTYTLDAGENPLRIDTETVGWIGNFMWHNRARLIHFGMPGAHRELEKARLVRGHGFFFKNVAYEDVNGVTRVVPYFVLSHLEPFVPPQDTLRMRDFALFVAGMTILLIVLFVVLLLRDRRKARQFQEELIRRRRARRERAGSPPSGPGPASA